MKKVNAILLIMFLSILLVNITVKTARATDTIIDTGAVGNYPHVSGSIIAFVTAANNLMYYNILNGQLVNTGFVVNPVVEISISGSLIVFISAIDNTLKCYDISTGIMQNIGVSFPWGFSGFSISGSIIALITGITGEVEYFDLSTNQLFDTGAIGVFIPSISGSIIAFNTIESQVGVDLNGDGNIGQNWVLRYYNITSGALVNTGLDSGMAPSISGSKIAFPTYTQEDGWGETTIRYFDISTQKVVDTGIGGMVNMSSLSGSIITYSDRSGIYNAGYYNILNGLSEGFNAASYNSPSIDGSIIAFQSGSYGAYEISYINISQATFDTPTGTDITINSVGTGLSATFSDVTNAGTTSVVASATNPGPNIPNFQFLNTFWKISTQASFTGSVIIGLSYDPSIAGQAESSLRVFHWDGTTWTDVTYSLDTVNKIIYAQVTSFSSFGIAYKTYVYSGLLQPVNNDGSSVFKMKSIVPLKFQLTDSQGNLVSNTKCYVYLTKISNGILGTEMEAVSTSAAESGNLFRYDGSHYVFNLATKSLSIGTWQIRIALDDGTSKYTIISLK